MLLQHTTQGLSKNATRAVTHIHTVAGALPGGDGRLVSVLILRDAEVTYHDCKVTGVSAEPVFYTLSIKLHPAMPLAPANYPEFKAFACLQQGRPKA